MSIYADLFIAYMKWLLFLLANTLFTSMRNLLWLVNGTHWQLLQNRKTENYDKCAHVMQVLFKHRLDIFVESRISDYVLVHEQFVNPDYVLRDDVSLLNITDTQAIFVQRKPGSSPPFKHNFLVIGQFGSADKIITMPLNQFNRLAESMKRDDGHILFLQNQSRCGGTLFTNIFMETGRCITFNEPHAINALCKYMYMDKIWTRRQAARIYRNTVHMLCKPYRSLEQEPLLYVIKPTVVAIITTDFVQEIMPEVVQLFVYRDPVQVAISLRRLGEALQTLRLLYYAPNIPKVVAPLLQIIGMVNEDYKGWTPMFHAELEIGYRAAALSMHHYLRARERGQPISALKYEDLVANPESLIRRLFEACRLPRDLVAKAIVAMSKDSQEETVFSRNKLKKLIPNPPKPDANFYKAARAMSEDFKVPGPDGWQDFHLEGSLLP